jgi:RNA polymerase subunit RPABC4/transcription elongation factor Spt4
VEIVLVLLWVICGIAAGMIATGRNANGCLWFGLGILLGPIGLALSFMAGSNRKCPHCQANVHQQATKCPKCQSALSVADAQTQGSPVGALTASTEEKFRCPKCKTPVEKDAERCPGCGGLFIAGLTKKCPECAESVKMDARKCRFCGFRFEAEKEPPQ